MLRLPDLSAADRQMQRDGTIGLIALVVASLLLLFNLKSIVFMAFILTLAYLLHLGLKKMGRLGDRIRLPLSIGAVIVTIHRLFELHK